METANKSSVLLKLKSGEYCLQEFSGKSDVWKNFLDVICKETKQYQGYVACQTCDSLFKYKHGVTGTSTLKRHSVNCSQSPQTSSSSSVPVQPKIVHFYKKTTIQSKDKDKLMDACISVCAADLRPMCIFEGAGMLEYSDCLIQLGAKYGTIKAKELLPARTTISRKIKSKSDDAIKLTMQEINKHFANSLFVAFTTDLWTDNYKHKTFFSLTCHYISMEWKLVDIILGCREFTSGKKTAENIRDETLGFMHAIGFEYADIYEKCFFVTDSGANVKSAFRQFKWFPCSCHILNSVLSNTFKSVQDCNIDLTIDDGDLHTDTNHGFSSEEDMSFLEYSVTFKELINACKELVTYFKRIGEIPEMGSLKQDTETRWNSKLMMITSILKEKSRIQAYLCEKNELSRLDKIDFGMLQSLCSFLQPFKICIETLEGSKYVTLHSVLLLKKKLLRHLQVEENESPLLVKLKQTAMLFLDQKWPITIVHKVATFLCPKFKNLSFLNVSERQEVHAHAREMIRKFNESVSITRTTACISSSAAAASDHNYGATGVQTHKTNFTNDLSEFEDEVGTSNAQVPVNDEVTKYINSNFQDGLLGEIDKDAVGGIDLITFWKSRVDEFPGLSTLARCILCIPASSASSERAFSISGRVFEERRTRLASDTLDSILALNSFKRLKN